MIHIHLNMLPRKHIHLCSKWLLVLSVITGYRLHKGYAVSPPTRFLDVSQGEYTEYVGNTKVLSCQATGDPPPLYSWLRNGQFVENYRNISQTLTMLNIQIDNAGEYQCLAANPYGAILSSKVQIHVPYLGNFPTRSTSEDVSVSEGRAAIISLPAIGSYPPATVRWLEERTYIDPARWTRHYVTLGNNLVVTETSQQDAKSFHAEARNDHLPLEVRQTHTFILRVQGTSDSSDIPPEIIIPPADLTVAEGTNDPIKLECVANARPTNYLTTLWFKKNGNTRVPINHDNNRNILKYNNRTLTVFNPSVRDAGVYQCEAVLSVPGQSYPVAQAEATVTVLELLRFGNLSPAVLSKDFGETVYILCNYTRNSGATFTWYKNGVNVQSLNNPRYEAQASGSLKINNLDPEDAGIFQCFASNIANSINLAVWLQVQSSAPVFVSTPRNISIVEGQDARFPCEANGAPKPSVYWTKVLEDGTSQNITTSERYQVKEGELLIASSESSDTGGYICWAHNSVGSASSSAYLIVTIRTQITQPPVDVAAVLGTTARFQCKVVNDPLVPVTIRWYMHINNNQRILIGSDPRLQVGNDGSLTIMAVNQVDIGTYECVVTSRGGNDSRTAQLTVIEKPTKPAIVSVSVSPTNQKSVNIQWVKPFDGNSPITKYIVQFRILPDGNTLPPSEGWNTADDNVPVPSPSSPISYTVGSLQPAKVYQFRVSAINAVGEGPYSDPSETVTIPQQPPSAAARGVLGRSKSNDTFFLQWQPPQEDFWNGPLRGFTIRFRLHGYDTNPWYYRNYTIDRPITETTTFYYDVTGLGVFVFQRYDVGVAAFNDKGVGVYSASIQVSTEEGVPRRAPSAFTVQAVNSTSVMAQWDPVDSQFMNGISLGFKLIYRKMNDVREQITNVPVDPANYYGTQTGYIINLEKFTEYRVSVLCYTSKGDGPRSPLLNVTTAEDVPDEVGSLLFPIVQHTSITGRWTRPANINGILQGYVLSHMVKNRTETRVVVNLGPDVLQYEILNLSPVTVYTIEVKAKSRVGAGPPRSADIKSGVPPEPPGAPTNVGVSDVLSRSARFQFEPGYDGKTSITMWLIEAQIGSAEASISPESPWKSVFNISAPDVKAFVVQNLRPYTYYRLRIIAQNVAGISAPSDATRAFQTTQDRPESAPKNVTVRAVNETAVRVSWMPLPSSEWNGEPEGYRIEYKAKNSPTFSIIDINDINMNSYTIVGLEEYTEYQGRMQARNEIDLGPYSSPIAKDKTWEAVPSSGPQNVNATAVNSVSIRVVWGDVPARSQNGLILGYKVQYSSREEGLSPEIVTVEGNMTKQYILTGLRKYVMYEIQVLAYTRIGDGVLSRPPKSTRTAEDVPGKPTIIYFPDVTFSTAKVVWAPPLEPNGIITGYRLTYQKKEGGPTQTNYTEAGRNEFTVYQLEREKTYTFTLTAKTRLGWGDSETVEVRTIKDRKKPDAPSTVQISNSQIQARAVTISWQPGFDWYGPIRNYTIQYQKEGDTWVTVPGLVPHTNTSHTIEGLSPSTRYIFRVAATNDKGTSEFSNPSSSVLTLEAAPDGAPRNLKVTPYTTTSVKVQWEPPSYGLWNGRLQGYVIQHHVYGLLDNWQSENLFSKDLNSITLEGFELFKTYEFRLAATNGLGQGPWSASQIVYMEIVPTASPESLLLEATSSTAIHVRWNPPPENSQNGALQGYKIFYWEDGKRAGTEKKALVEAASTEITLQDLKMYTIYNIRVLAYNPAGDGPNTTIASARTKAGIPGRPGELFFHNVSLDSLNVTWTPPEEPNGVIINYEVVYTGASKTVQVEVDKRRTYYFARDLEEGVTYNFSVRAETDLGYGPYSSKVITTGSQQGSPGPPTNLLLDYGSSAVTLEWTNGAEGASAVNGYIIQSKATTDDSWRTVLRKNSAGPAAVIPFDNLSPNTIFQFRVIAVNDHGISDPSPASQPLQTPALSSRAAEPEQKIYEQWWFLVIVALCGLILIIIVVSLLSCRAKRNKEPFPANSKVMTPVTMPPPTEDGHSVIDDDGGFTSFEMRESIRRSKRSVANGKKNNYVRSPPRPSPASVTYSDEESKPPGYDEDGSSTTSGKPSDLDSDSQESDSEPPSEKGSQAAASQPRQSSSFMTANPYVNDPVRQSWKRQKSNSKAYSYTDSEQESSHYATSLNGGHIIMNNMAGSRAPLPGFSSFV